MEEYNRANVNRIKKIIIFVIVLLCTVPTILCIYLMVQLNRMEKKLDAYIEEQSTGAALVNQEPEGTLYNEENFAENMDEQAYDMLEKGTNETKQLTLKDVEGEEQPEWSGQPDRPQSEEPDDTYNTNDTDDADDTDDSDEEILNGKKVYLTFDDGPSVYTDEILDILKEEDVKATFFVVAKDASYNDKYNRIVAEGHTLGMHSYSHVYKTIYANLDSFKNDVDGIHDLLYDVTGVDVRYYRFPGGSSNTVSDVDIQECIQYLDEKGYTYFDWNALNGDAVTETLTAEELNENIMKYVHGNKGDSIVLMHDLSARHTTVEALPALIHTLKEEGYEIVPIDDTTEPVHHVKDEAQEQ